MLMIGNVMNGKNFRGGAFGFKISSINSLVDTTVTYFVDVGR
jgi:cytokinesis protein